MSTTNLSDVLLFPARTSTHRGEWIPLYLEPLPGSGERVCIGVIASDGQRVRTVHVPRLERLSCAYGAAAESLAWVARLVMLEAGALAEARGLAGLVETPPVVEGLILGDMRIGAGRDLHDLAELALRQSSTLLAGEPDGATLLAAPRRQERSSHVGQAVRRAVVTRRPDLVDHFFRSFSFSQSARPTQYGFVGGRVVANFTTLGGSADTLSAQVDRAKARLWDLEQLQKGVLRDVFGEPMATRQFELMACPPVISNIAEKPKHPVSVDQLSEAAVALEREADKFDIRWRILANPQLIADELVRREEAA